MGNVLQKFRRNEDFENLINFLKALCWCNSLFHTNKDLCKLHLLFITKAEKSFFSEISFQFSPALPLVVIFIPYQFFNYCFLPAFSLLSYFLPFLSSSPPPTFFTNRFHFFFFFSSHLITSAGYLLLVSARSYQHVNKPHNEICQ